MAKKYEIITKNKEMEKLMAEVKKAVNHPKVAKDRVIMLLGESGTGKELMARYAREVSPRKDKPFIAKDISAMPPTLLESELFGYEKGAFTGAIQQKKGIFERANGGTVFLDEIGDIDKGIQQRLVRLLQERVIERIGGDQQIDLDVMIIAATNKDINKLVADKLLREDLYFRLETHIFRIPPLRNRPNDLPRLIKHIIAQFDSESGIKNREFDKEAVELIKRCMWWGNIRELASFIERLLLKYNETRLFSKQLIDPYIQEKILEERKKKKEEFNKLDEQDFRESNVYNIIVDVFAGEEGNKDTLRFFERWLELNEDRPEWILDKLPKEGERRRSQKKFPKILGVKNEYLIDLRRELHLRLASNEKRQSNEIACDYKNPKHKIDRTTGIEELKIQADNSNEEAQLQLAERYFYGNSVEQDYEKARYYYEFAALKGVLKAQYKLGHLFLEGLGVKRDEKRGLEWLLKAADNGCQYSKIRICRILHYEGLYDLKTTDLEILGDRNRFNFLKEAVNAGSISASIYLALEYVWRKSNDDLPALHILSGQKMLNRPQIFYLLGLYNETGKHFDKNMEDAFKYLQKAANMEYAIAQTRVGEFYEAGITGKPDGKLAFEWYEKAAKQGDRIALTRLGLKEISKTDWNDPKSVNNKYFRLVSESEEEFAENRSACKEVIFQFTERNDDLVDKFDYEKISKRQDYELRFKIYANMSETCWAFIDFTRWVSKKSLIVLGEEGLHLTNDTGASVFCIPYYSKGMESIQTYKHGIQIDDEKWKFAGLPQKVKEELCTTLRILNCISSKKPNHEKRKQVEMTILKSICMKGFPTQSVSIPLEQIAEQCLFYRLSIYNVLDNLTVQQVYYEVKGDEISFYTS
jgi:DNA-binding NtrC family response regulator/TPR repeat protein